MYRGYCYKSSNLPGLFASTLYCCHPLHHVEVDLGLEGRKNCVNLFQEIKFFSFLTHHILKHWYDRPRYYFVLRVILGQSEPIIIRNVDRVPSWIQFSLIAPSWIINYNAEWVSGSQLGSDSVSRASRRLLLLSIYWSISDIKRSCFV